jgi:hypothetical protein
MRILFGISFFLILFSCKRRNPEGILWYFPSDTVFEKGFAAKYYFRYEPIDPDTDAKIRISYSVYKKSDDNHFLITSYNAGFEYTGSQYYRIEDQNLFLDSSFYLSQGDTLKAQITEPWSKSWQSDQHPIYEEKYSYQGVEYLYEIEQLEIGDTLINGQKGKFFLFDRRYRNIATDSLVDSNRSTEIYLENIGFFSSSETSENGSFSSELIEQMPIDSFLLRANHGEKRIAFINPKESLGGDPGFALCGPEKDIFDYYNGDPDAGFLHGKKEMLSIINDQIIPEKLKGQNGMLTYRFVINCKGKAGRFIFRGYDFDYQAKKFPASARTHLLEILLSLKTWQPCVIRSENSDSYAYITFKIKDGEIIDVLP